MDEIIKELRELAEHHQSLSDEALDVDAARARTCMTAAAMLEDFAKVLKGAGRNWF
jgi:hypothetical protein